MTKLNYVHVNRELAAEDNASLAAGVHGICVGFVCAGEKKPPDWQKFVQKYAMHIESAQLPTKMIDNIYAEAIERLTAEDLSFELWLPDDSQLLITRATAFQIWCEGFLLSLNYAGINLQTIKQNEVKEALEAITAMCHLDVEQLANNENLSQNERDFEEIIGFVRISVMLIFFECTN